MKKYLSLIIFFFILVGCKKQSTENKLITEKIQYDVLINNTEPDIEWWIQNIEGPKRDKFINLIFSAIKDNSLKIYNTNNESTSLENVFSSLFTFDTIQLQKNGKKEQSIDTVFITSVFSQKKINQIRFREKWMFDEKTLQIEKKVESFCPEMLIENPEKGNKLIFPLFWIIPDSTQKSEDKDLITITPKIMYDVFIKSENDKNKWFVDNIVTSDREYFLNKIIEVASKGKLKIYDYFDRIIDKEGFQNILNRKDTVLVENLEDPGSFTQKVTDVSLDIKSISKIRFIEEWKINTKTFTFYKIVKAISLLSENRENDGSLRGYTPVFYIYFDESIKNITKN